MAGEPMDIERDIRSARTNVERDIVRIADALDHEAKSKVLALAAGAAALGLLIGFGGMKAIKIMLTLGIAGAAAAMLWRKFARQ